MDYLLALSLFRNIFHEDIIQVLMESDFFIRADIFWRFL